MGAGSEVIWSDSLYAINMTTGKWRPKCTRNREIVARLRGVWRRLQRARPREVQLQHVRSHIKVPGNELADWLADNGRISDRKGVTEATRWMRVWMTRQHVSAMGRHAGSRGAGPAQIGSRRDLAAMDEIHSVHVHARGRVCPTAGASNMP